LGSFKKYKEKLKNRKKWHIQSVKYQNPEEIKEELITKLRLLLYGLARKLAQFTFHIELTM
jgi:hypothetical protein